MTTRRFRELSPDAPELAPILNGLFGEYAERYQDYFSRDAEEELTEWYLPPHGLFLVLEQAGEIIATGAYKPYDPQTAELKRIWTRRDWRRQGIALVILQELERRVDELAEETDLPSGDALAAELTRFLREEDQRRDNGDDVARDQ